jgi:hypothetical protein
MAAAPREPGQPSPLVVSRNHPSEREAERAARAVLARDPAPVLAPRTRGVSTRGVLRQAQATPPAAGIDLVFIMGRDTGRNPFYAAAVTYFRQHHPGATLVNDDQYRSLEAVFEYLRQHGGPVANLYLVSHANEDGTLSFPLRATGARRRTTYGDVRSALKDAPELFQLPRGVITEATTIRIKGCNIGRSTRMLDALDRAFGGRGTVVAPTHRQGYGTSTRRQQGVSTTESYEEFQDYFIEYPGRRELSRAEQLTAFAAKYSHLGEAWWQGRVPAQGARRDTVQTTYTHRYEIDVLNTDTRAVAEDQALEQAVAWAKENIGRPDLYKWRVQSTTQAPGAWRTVVVGEKTNYVVPGVLRDAAGARLVAAENDPTYFGRSTYSEAPRGATRALAAEWLELRTLERELPAGELRERVAARRSDVEDQLRRRRATVEVEVRKTEDWLGADEVYVRVGGPEEQATSDVHDLDDGERHAFTVPVSALMPLDRPSTVEVYDEDLGWFLDRDDLIVRMVWQAPFAPLENRESLDEADYRVKARL